MPTEIRVQIGCEPGSEWCGECRYSARDSKPCWCNAFEVSLASVGFASAGISARVTRRCPACLDAEVPTGETLRGQSSGIGPEAQRVLAMWHDVSDQCPPMHPRMAWKDLRDAYAADGVALPDESPGLGGEPDRAGNPGA